MLNLNLTEIQNKDLIYLARATLLESLSSTLSDSDQRELRQNLIAIAASKEGIGDRVAVHSASMPSPFSVVNNCVRSSRELFRHPYQH